LMRAIGSIWTATFSFMGGIRQLSRSGFTIAFSSEVGTGSREENASKN
jgi:hypothetical protein